MESQEAMAAVLPRCPTGIAFQAGREAVLKEFLFSGEILGEVTGDRNLETLALVGLDHQENPKDKHDQADEADQESANHGEAKAGAKAPAAHPPTHAEDNAQNDAHDVQSTKDDQGLSGVEADERALIDQEKDKPGEPAKNVAEQTRHVLAEARLRPSGRGSRARGRAATGTEG